MKSFLESCQAKIYFFQFILIHSNKKYSFFGYIQEEIYDQKEASTCVLDGGILSYLQELA